VAQSSASAFKEGEAVAIMAEERLRKFRARERAAQLKEREREEAEKEARASAIRLGESVPAANNGCFRACGIVLCVYSVWLAVGVLGGHWLLLLCSCRRHRSSEEKRRLQARRCCGRGGGPGWTVSPAPAECEQPAETAALVGALAAAVPRTGDGGVHAATRYVVAPMEKSGKTASHEPALYPRLRHEPKPEEAGVRQSGLTRVADASVAARRLRLTGASPEPRHERQGGGGWPARLARQHILIYGICWCALWPNLRCQCL
jgi:hypothetical protein